VFLASVAEEAMNNTSIKNYDIVGFLLVKKLLQLIDFLKQTLADRSNSFKLEYAIYI
jgi:serine/threonine-protein kinase ULK/ATG1